MKKIFKNEVNRNIYMGGYINKYKNYGNFDNYKFNLFIIKYNLLKKKNINLI